MSLPRLSRNNKIAINHQTIEESMQGLKPSLKLKPIKTINDYSTVNTKLSRYAKRASRLEQSMVFQSKESSLDKETHHNNHLS